MSQTEPADLPTMARKAWAALETLHVVGYFEAEPREAYKAIGLRGRYQYMAARSAPMGAVSPGVTVASFYLFAPRLVRETLPHVWQIATPDQVVQARFAGATAALRRLIGDVDVREVVELVRQACAGLRPEGRTLYAGHADLDWPHEPLTALWHGATLLREHRGDGHIATLLGAGLEPVEALLLGGYYSGGLDFTRATRGWTDEEWAAAEHRLTDRGLVADGGLTDAGRLLRNDIEAKTDALALEGWAGLGLAGTSRVFDIVRPWRRAVLGGAAWPAGLLPEKK